MPGVTPPKIADRVAAFRAQIKPGSVRVNVYGDSASKSIKNLMLYAAIVAGAFVGAAIEAGTFAAHHQEPQVPGYHQLVPGSLSGLSNGPPEPMPEGAVVRPPKWVPTLNYVDVTHNGRQFRMLDELSRIWLVKEMARQHELESVGLDWKDLYGLIHAETAWIARDGLGKNGVTSVGLAQMEPNTAKSLNIANPLDPIEAISGAAVLMKEAATWSRYKLSGLRLGKHEKSQKMREGISVYYNLSSAGRRLWDGTNTEQMPVETQRHIFNTKDGANLAGSIEKKIQKDAIRDFMGQGAKSDPVAKDGFVRAESDESDQAPQPQMTA